MRYFFRCSLLILYAFNVHGAASSSSSSFTGGALASALAAGQGALVHRQQFDSLQNFCCAAIAAQPEKCGLTPDALPPVIMRRLQVYAHKALHAKPKGVLKHADAAAYPGGGFEAVVFTDDKRLYTVAELPLAVCGATIDVWDMQTGERLKEVDAGVELSSLFLSHDQRLLFAQQHKKPCKVYVYDLVNYERVGCLGVPVEKLQDRYVALSPDDTFLYEATPDGIGSINVSSGQYEKEHTRPAQDYRCDYLTLNDDGTFLFSPQSEHIVVYDTHTLALVKRIAFNKGRCETFAYSAGSLLLKTMRPELRVMSDELWRVCVASGDVQKKETKDTGNGLFKLIKNNGTKKWAMAYEAQLCRYAMKIFDANNSCLHTLNLGSMKSYQFYETINLMDRHILTLDDEQRFTLISLDHLAAIERTLKICAQSPMGHI